MGCTLTLSNVQDPIHTMPGPRWRYRVGKQSASSWVKCRAPKHGHEVVFASSVSCRACREAIKGHRQRISGADVCEDSHRTARQVLAGQAPMTLVSSVSLIGKRMIRVPYVLTCSLMFMHHQAPVGKPHFSCQLHTAVLLASASTCCVW